MNQTNQTNQTNQSDDEIPLLDYWRVIWKRRTLVGGLCFVVVLAAFVISFYMPKIYESTATLLPQLEINEGGGLGALLAATGAGSAAERLGISLPGAPATPTDIFLGMLKSRTMADEVIKKFNLKEYYEAKTIEDARNALGNNTTILLSKEKVIKITVQAKSPQLAADMANFYVSTLDQLSRTLNVTKAGQNRAFIERRLSETKSDLEQAEVALKDFQKQNKTVAVEAQSKAMIEAAAMIQGQITAQEVQSKVMSGYLSPDNPELSRVHTIISELKKQLAIMSTGKGDTEMPRGTRLHPAMIAVPGLALDYGRLLRELKIHETVYTLLTAQYEQAKLAEARDTPTVQVLDQAIPAEKKSKPSIRLNMAIAGVLALFVGIFLAFFLEYMDRVRQPAKVLATKS
jgi:tyrosine-protein kinase Etk/Wzc